MEVYTPVTISELGSSDHNIVLFCFAADKPWVIDWFRDLFRKGQRAHMSGYLNQAKILRNKVNRAASKLK